LSPFSSWRSSRGTGLDPSPFKPPVWTWEVPLYFFVGGVAGISAVIALVASMTGADAGTVDAARWVAATGAVVSPLLLISDLGRPARFPFMLRVFKPTSAMSVGAWTLLVFSAAVVAALGLSLVGRHSAGVGFIVTPLDIVAAATGLVLATYTGVLLGATVIPAWAERHRWLPFEFGISSLGAAASVVELAGGYTSALHRAALAAAVIETALWGLGLLSRRHGRRAELAGLTAWAAVFSGPVALLLRLAGFGLPSARVAAGLCAIGASVMLRYGWLAAGRTSPASMRK